jgi:high-affinity iron transporter
VVIVVIIGAAMIGAFYGLGKDVFSKAEDLWEGIFCILASIIITLMGAALLRVSKFQEKWRVKIAKAIESKDSMGYHHFGGRFKAWCERYALFVLPFITVLREGLEAVVFVGGVGIGMPASAFPLAVFCGLLAGIFIGYLIYKGGNKTSLQIFLIVSTCVLYLVAAGLFSRGVWLLQNHQWNLMVGGDMSEVGSGPGSYNIHWSVWHVNCCNPQIRGGGGWGIFYALLGWVNSATYGSVISYNIYWIFVIATFVAMRYNEVNGHWPLVKPKKRDSCGSAPMQESKSVSVSLSPSDPAEQNDVEKAVGVKTVEVPREVCVAID